MTLFSSDDLNQVFPEATADALTDPNEVIYSGYAEAYVEAQESAGRVALTGGSEDAIGDILKSDPNKEVIYVDKHFTEIVNDSLKQTTELLEDTIVLSLKEKENISELMEKTDWVDLEQVYRYFEILDLEPQLVIAPEGMPADYWESLFINLSDWRIPNYKSTQMLANNGLFIDPEVKEHWSSISRFKSPTWTISIIAGTIEKSFKDHDFSFASDDSETNIKNVMKEMFYLGLIERPTIESYLMMQAQRCYFNKEMVDKDQHAWLDGLFQTIDSASTLSYPVAPTGRHGSFYNRISIQFEVIDEKSNCAIRPVYRAKFKDSK